MTRDNAHPIAWWADRAAHAYAHAYDGDDTDGLSRREFMRLLGASMALAGLGGCIREPDQKILPYVSTPSNVVPGLPLHYATAMTIDGYGTGLIVESHAGHPTKIEGNPDHPMSLGAAGVFEQASVLQLYDPHRARDVRFRGQRTTWRQAEAALAPAALRGRVGARGAGLRLLLEPTSSPLVAAMLADVQTAYPDARVYFYAPLASTGAVEAARALFSQPLLPHYDLQAADVIVALDADIVGSGPAHLRYARQLGARHRAGAQANDGTSTPLRLYVAASNPSPTSNVANDHLAARPSVIGHIAAALFGKLSSRQQPVLTSDVRAWVDRVAADLTSAQGRCVVIAGDQQPVEVHVMAHAINMLLGVVEHTVWYASSPILDVGTPSHDLTELVKELDAGDVDTLVMLEGNPAYAAPADLEMVRRIRTVRNPIYAGMYDDETARIAAWHLPIAHYLESWGDVRAYDGTVSLVQPLIAPLYNGRTVAELLAIIGGRSVPSAHALLQQHWQSVALQPAPFVSSLDDVRWDDALRRGIIADSAFARSTTVERGDAVDRAHTSLLTQAQTHASAQGSIELIFTPSRTVYDGRFADNAWLQELPDPITKLTWDNAALVSPDDARRLGLESGDIVTLHARGRQLDVPALIVSGHADRAISLALGYGRDGGEAVARDVGCNANTIRTATAPFVDDTVTVTRAARQHPLAVTQRHQSVGERAASIIGTGAHATSRALTLYEPPTPAPDGYGRDQWAMTIDLDLCTGCSACVIACQAENNIPVVGKQGVLDGREMQWIRIDRYVDAPADTSSDASHVVSQPMLCQHCEKAPCEYVCPVNATTHSDDGLNEMVYNRCVGTRFCSNNCPYKVRRFNWFDYNAEIAATERLVKNPDVTVRERGVMEKCTFCVQRLRDAQRQAELAGASQTGPVMTACQQTCPTNAIIFGSLTDPASAVTQSRHDPRSFAVLDELGTEPRVRYLSKTSASRPTARHD